MLCVGDWEKHTLYGHGYTKDSVQIGWFWQMLRSLSKDVQFDLLAMVTGSRNVGPGGFAVLSGFNGESRQFTIRRGKRPRAGREWPLPSAMTCFNTLCLPPYESRDLLKRKVLRALEEFKHGDAFQD